MKKLMLTSILAALVALGTTGIAQDYPDEYLGLPGDNLNLYAVMKLFQESETLEGFERNLNDEKTKINNLDLNGDNLIDYITVTDYPDGNDHTIVLKVSLGRKEFQDIAVFTVQKFNNGSVQIQLIGDESLYGKNYIIEPIYEETPNPGYMGRPETRTYVTEIRTTPYEIAYWPVIRYIYMPGYVVWRSSWHWGYYPDWWNPWRPYYWHYYYGYHYNWYTHYYSHYHHWHVCRWDGYNDRYYHRVRAYSPTVVVNISKNVYRTSYSRPDQRKEGEALYTRMHPDRETRAVATRNESVNGRQNTGARSAERPSTTERTQVSKSSAPTRQAADSRPSSAGERPQVSRSSGEERSSASRPSVQTQRSTSSAPERSSVQTQRTSTVSSSKSQAQTRSNSSSAPSRSSVQTQRSTTASPSRSSGQTQRSSSAAPSRSSSQSRPAATRSSSSGSKSSSSSSRSSDRDSNSGSGRR